MTVPLAIVPAATRTRHLDLPEPLGPVDPAGVSPVHLPALAHVAAELDTCSAPIRVVRAKDLGVCVECADPRNVEPVRDAIATVVAYADELTTRHEACPLHLDDVIRDHARRGHTVTVEVPAFGGHTCFSRHERETFYAVDASTGLVVTRDVIDTWSVYVCVENAAPVLLAARMGVAGVGSARERAEVLAQAYASQLATDAALATDVLTLDVAA